MKNTKIFVDCHVFDGPFQGSTSYLRGLYFQLIKQRNITFFLASNDPNHLEMIFGRHENVVYLKYQCKNKFSRLLIDIPFLISKYKIDFAHFQYIVSPIKRCKYIVTIHDVMFLDFPQYFPKNYKIKNKFLFQWSAKKSEIVLTVSNYSKNRIEHHFNLKKIFVTHNAVDAVFLESFPKVAAQEYIQYHFGITNFFLFVSRFEPRKNHITLLKVFIENKYYLDRELVFIGNDAIECKDFDRYYNTLADEIRSKIKILKKVNFNDLVQFTRAADLSIYPSIAEGFGIPPLESVAVKTPTICSNTTAMSDFNFIREFLFRPLDEKEMNEKIQQALVHSNWEHNKLEMLKKYNWENSAKEFLKAID
jgi:glycosyltransferase involved in cell wall biosynthesis